MKKKQQQQQQEKHGTEKKIQVAVTPYDVVLIATVSLKSLFMSAQTRIRTEHKKIHPLFQHAADAH